MKTVVRVRLDMADRVLIFNASHPPTDAGTQVAFDELAAEVTNAKALASVQLSGQKTARSATLRRKVLKAELQGGVLGYLVRVGEAAARELPELAAHFQLPRANLSNRAYLTAAGNMLATAQAHRELFVRLGFTEELFTQLAGRLEEFGKVTEEGGAARQQHIGASADLDQVAAAITELVERINRLNRHRFRDDPEVLRIWDCARNVVRPVKATWPSAQTGTGGPPETPPSGTPPGEKAA